jgi:hypothetical protein
VPSDPLKEADRIIDAAAGGRATLRLLGGLAILERCPSARAGPLQRRSAPDIDLAGLSKENKQIRQVFAQVGYLPNQSFNALHGYKRLMFHGPEGHPKVDVFLDRLEMSHNLDFRSRLSLGARTLPLADLLFTKLQVFEITEKDLRDAAAMLLDHETADRDEEEGINIRYLAELTSTNWGAFTTVADNLTRLEGQLSAFGLTPGALRQVAQRARRLREAMEAHPKSLGWKLRARVGRRMVWYEVPEEPKAIPLGKSE